MKSTVMNGEYRNVPLATLTESTTNPRKRFDEKALEELAATFKTQGVLEPLLVRELEERSSKALETKPTLVQISSAWNNREGAPLGRNHYVELQIKKARTNGERAKLSAFQKALRKHDRGHRNGWRQAGAHR
jgi:hypothetical protein